MVMRIALALVGIPALTAAAQQDLAPIRQYRQAHGPRILGDFVELLSMPNVASDADNIRRNAEYIRDALARRGARAELLELSGAPPVVFGTLTTSGAGRTLGIYIHYDGQPVDASQWRQPPWQPTLYTAAIENGGRPRALPKEVERIDPEWRMYARSAGDDKAPLMALLTALDALRAGGIEPTSNLVFLFEGEEEAGSPHLRQFMEKYRDKLAADVWLFCDGPVHQSRRPQIVFGVRGYSGLDITVYGANRYLHSGHYGNWAPNPALRLARLLASMKDDRGTVLIDGFYDCVEPLGSEEREALARVPDIETSLRAELGLAESEGAGTALEKRLLLPSLNIRGMVSATVGPTARNIIPPTATASLDIRLVKGCDPKGMLDRTETHIARQGFHIVRTDPDPATRQSHPRIAKVVRRHGYRATRVSMSLPIVQVVVAAAERAAGGEVVRLPTLGGSGPLYLFEDLLGAPAITVPSVNHDNNQHAPNENVRIANLWYGIDLMAALLTMPR